MRCSVKSGNERNPCHQLPASKVGDSGETACVKQEEGADDVKSVWPLRPGLHTCYNGGYNGKQSREAEQIHKTEKRSREAEQIYKTGLSSDCSLQLDCMKLESLVNAYQLRRIEYVPGPCTHRPSHHGS